MATCEKREIVQPKPPVEYVLTLSEDEARVLRRLVAQAIWPVESAHQIADIYSAIHNSGVPQ